jgi:DNA polymerase-3 subunit gamma/tau
MSMISRRPRRWNEVVGQDRVLRVLQAVLGQPRFMTRGHVFEGPFAVGKTSCAYLFARALMCLGSDPMGCGDCPSCIMMDQSINEHPALTEVDAASCSGVQDARALMAQLEGPATLGKRRVVIMDEAWDVFLKPLELDDTSVVTLFITTEAKSIPETISSRCAVHRFGMVSTDALTGMIMAVADKMDVAYTLEGLQTVARHAHGRPRDAVKNLGLVAATGKVTKEATDSVLNYDSDTIAGDIFTDLLIGDFRGAVARADELGQRIGPAKVVETLFTAFSRDVFADRVVASRFTVLGRMTKFFLKWSNVSHIPLDALPLFILELNDLRKGKTQEQHSYTYATETDEPGPTSAKKVSFLVLQQMMEG